MQMEETASRYGRYLGITE